MNDPAGISSPVETQGRLCWNEFEGGFWSLELVPDHPTLGQVVVPTGFTPPAGAADGSLLRLRLRPQHEQFGFTMAGVRVEVLDARIAD